MLSFFFQDYTAELDKLADNAGMARLWAGIHWRSDHEQGMRLGRCVARLIIQRLIDSRICPPDVCHEPVRCAPPPSRDDLKKCAETMASCCDNPDNCPPPYCPGCAERAERQGGGAVSSAAERSQAQGPQEGAGSGAAEEAAREQAKGPQEGAK